MWYWNKPFHHFLFMTFSNTWPLLQLINIEEAVLVRNKFTVAISRLKKTKHTNSATIRTLIFDTICPILEKKISWSDRKRQNLSL